MIIWLIFWSVSLIQSSKLSQHFPPTTDHPLPVPRYSAQAALGHNLTQQEFTRHSILSRTDLAGLKNKKLMLLHGVEDQQVSLENTLALADTLVKQNIMFQQKVGARIVLFGRHVERT